MFNCVEGIFKIDKIYTIKKTIIDIYGQLFVASIRAVTLLCNDRKPH